MLALLLLQQGLVPFVFLVVEIEFVKEQQTMGTAFFLLALDLLFSELLHYILDNDELLIRGIHGTIEGF